MKVGVLFSQTGVTSIVERTQLDATLLAIDEINAGGGLHGRALEPVVYDPASDPALFRRFAHRLLREDGVSVLFGCYMSSARRAIVPIIESHNALLCYPTFYEGFEYSPNVLYCGSLPNQTNVVLAKYLIKTFGRRIYFLGSDYIFPHECNRLMNSIIAKEGGQVVGERYVPLGSPAAAFELATKEIRLARPDAVFSTVVGEDVASLYQALARAGGMPPVGSVATTEAELSLLPPGTALGHVTAAPYFATVETRESRHFVEAYRARHGRAAPPNMCAEAAYLGVFLVAQGIRSAGTGQPRAIIQALHGCRFDAPQGAVRVDAENNHVYLFSRIGRVEADGRFAVVEQSSEALKPDPYLVDYDLPWVRPVGEGPDIAAAEAVP